MNQEMNTVINIKPEENEVITVADAYHEEALRERLCSLRSAGLSNEAIKVRLKNYRYRYFKGLKYYAFAGQAYVREVKLMLDAYTKLAEERGII